MAFVADDAANLHKKSVQFWTGIRTLVANCHFTDPLRPIPKQRNWI